MDIHVITAHSVQLVLRVVDGVLIIVPPAPLPVVRQSAEQLAGPLLNEQIEPIPVPPHKQNGTF